LAKKMQNTRTYDVTHREPKTQIKKMFFSIESRRLTWIHKGFEQLSSFRGWQVVAKNVHHIGQHRRYGVKC